MELQLIVIPYTNKTMKKLPKNFEFSDNFKAKLAEIDTNEIVCTEIECVKVGRNYQASWNTCPADKPKNIIEVEVIKPTLAELERFLLAFLS